MSEKAYSPRVLIVDDEEEIRWQLMQVFLQEKIQCDTATNGEKGLKLFNLEPYDIVISDLRMPEQHGQWLVQQLLNLPKPPIIYIVTGLSDPRLTRDLMGQGVEDIALKPIDPVMFAAKVLGSFERKQRIQPVEQVQHD